MAITIIPPAQAKAILKRMAYQIWEHNYAARRINLLGVSPVGEVLCAQLAALLKQTTPLEIKHDKLTVSALAPNATLPSLQLQFDAAAPLVLVDDVLYTGKTLFKALQLVATQPAQSFQVAVLVDRGHRSYPISPDFVGMRLATTLQEYVRVAHDGDGIAAVLA
jgi:pyrimidine operon attenuation protein/uracil phosphoribosyltransferase